MQDNINISKKGKLRFLSSFTVIDLNPIIIGKLGILYINKYYTESISIFHFNKLDKMYKNDNLHNLF